MRRGTHTANRGWRPVRAGRSAAGGVADVWQRLSCGEKLGGTPLVEYTRDRLHRETAAASAGRHMNLPPPGIPAASPEQAPEPSAA